MKYASDTLRFYWRRIQYFCVTKILRANDPPHSLAMGIAIGMLVAFLPIVGVKMGLSVALAWVLRANKAVGVPLVWLSNPLTAIPMYYPGYWLGCKILQIPEGNQWHQLLSFDGGFQALLERLSDSFAEVVLPLCVGSAVVALAVAATTYFMSVVVIKKYRLRRWGQLVPPVRRGQLGILA